MAVIEELGLCVTVHIAGRPLEEYDYPQPESDLHKIEKDAKAVCRKYIEAKDDAEYGIHVKTSPNHDFISEDFPKHVFKVNVFIDGRRQSPTCFDWEYQNRHGYLAINQTTEYHDSHRRTSRKFRFSSFKTVESAEPEVREQDFERAKDLGVIRVSLIRGRMLGKVAATACTKGEEPREGALSNVEEAALKGNAVSHTTSLSAPVETKSRSGYKSWVNEYIDKHPYAVFTFRYRSKDALRSEGVVARTPSPAGAENGAEEVTEEALALLSPEEIRRLAKERLTEVLKQERGIKAERQGVKREYDVAFDILKHPTQKRERKQGPCETIDLTND